jgi:putative FmdB family regulatory protein
MPLYEYKCDACGHRFEKIQKFSDPLETTCPKCGGVVHKLMSSPAIQFKGSGFYITDYAKKDYVSASKRDSDAESGKNQKSEKNDTPAKSEKSEKSDKTEKAASSSDSSSSTTSPAPAAAPAKTSTGD